MVAIKSHASDAYLAKPPDEVRTFLFHGGDRGLAALRIERLLEAARARSGTIVLTRFDGAEVAADPGRVADEVRSGSLFGGEPVVHIRLNDGRQNLAAAIAPLLDEPPNPGLCLIEAGDLRPTHALRKIVEGSANGAAVACYAGEGEAAALARAYAERHGKAIDADALALLRTVLGNDMLLAQREIEKLVTYAGDAASIRIGDVEAVVGDNGVTLRDRVIDGAFTGHFDEVEMGLQRLEAAGESLQGLATQALKHAQTMARLRLAVEAGGSVQRAMASARPPIFYQRQGAVRETLTLWSSAGLIRATHYLSKAIYGVRRSPSLGDAQLSQALFAIATQAGRQRGRDVRR